MIRFALVDGVFDKNPQIGECEWGELVTMLRTHRKVQCACVGRPYVVGEKVECPHKFGEAWVPVALKVGAEKLIDKAVESVTVAVFDLDDVPQSDFLKLAERLDGSGLAYVVHSTHTSNPPNAYRARLALKLTKPVPVERWERTRAAIIARLGIPADPVTLNPSRIYFLPSTPADREPITAYKDGDGIDFEQLAPSPVPSFGAPTLAPNAVAGPVDLDAIRGALKQVRGDHGELIRRVLKGEALAQHGSRDLSLNALVSVAAFKCPNAPDAALLELFRPSIAAMPCDPEGFDHWLEQAAYKLGRARVRYAEAQDQKATEREALARMIRNLNGPPVGEEEPERSGYYADEEIERWATEQGCTVPVFNATRWVVQFGSRYFIFADGKYREGLAREAAENTFARDLLPASNGSVQLVYTVKGDNGKDKVRPAKLSDVVKSHGTVADALSYSLIAPASTYDPRERTFYVSAAKRRAIEPRFNAHVHRWLELLGGPESERLFDWIATVTHLDRPSCAIYFEGPPRTGKSMFAEGLAKIWSPEGSSKLTADKLVGFNSAFLQCPLLFCDETIAGGRNAEDASALVRDLITSSTHDLRRKFLDGARIRGAFRVVFAANNSRLLRFSEQMTEEDIAALESRFLYVYAGKEAADYLASLGGRKTTEAWVAGDAIAAHALHLCATRKVEAGERLIVEGRSLALREKLATMAGVSPSICEWMIKALLKPSALRGEWHEHLIAGNGEVWINTAVLTDADRWNAYVGSERVPTLKQAAQSLRGMAIRPIVQPRRRVKAGRIHYHRLSGALLLRQAREFQLYADDLEELINASNPEMTKAIADA